MILLTLFYVNTLSLSLHNNHSNIVFKEVQENLSKNEKCVIMKRRLCVYEKREMEKSMKKRILAFIICLCMVATLVGCGNGEISNDKIRIKQYKGLEVEEVVLEVTDEDIEMSIQSTLETMSTTTPVTDRAAQEGDLVTIDYVGKLDGVEFDRGSATNQSVEIGAGMYVEGFEEGIIGHNIGETFDVDVTFPETYTEELAGKAVVFTMTLHAISTVSVPELTEDLLPQLSETAKTIEEYKEEVRADLEVSNKETIASSLEQEVWNALLENCVVDSYPEDEITEFVAYVEEQLGEAAAENDMEAAEMFESYYGVTPEDYIKNSIKLQYAIKLIAEKEKITLTAKEYEEGLAEYAAGEGYTDVDEYEEAIGRETIELWLLQPKVGELLVENCKQVAATTEE